MKRWIVPGVGIGILLLLLGLFSTAWNPGNFTGNWYSAPDGTLYRFQEGLISREETGIPEGVCGAYCFDRNSVAVFADGVPGLEEPAQLYLVRKNGGDRLCETKDGSGKTFFCRDRDTALKMG